MSCQGLEKIQTGMRLWIALIAVALFMLAAFPVHPVEAGTLHFSVGNLVNADINLRQGSLETHTSLALGIGDLSVANAEVDLEAGLAGQTEPCGASQRIDLEVVSCGSSGELDTDSSIPSLLPTVNLNAELDAFSGEDGIQVEASADAVLETDLVPGASMDVNMELDSSLALAPGGEDGLPVNIDASADLGLAANTPLGIDLAISAGQDGTSDSESGAPPYVGDDNLPDSSTNVPVSDVDDCNSGCLLPSTGDQDRLPQQCRDRRESGIQQAADIEDPVLSAGNQGEIVDLLHDSSLYVGQSAVNPQCPSGQNDNDPGLPGFRVQSAGATTTAGFRLVTSSSGSGPGGSLSADNFVLIRPSPSGRMVEISCYRYCSPHVPVFAVPG